MLYADAICQTLLDLGFKWSIGMIGIHSLHFYNSIKKSKLKSILVSSEKNVNYMACGHIIKNNALTIFVNIISPGLLHSIQGLEYAYKNKIPLFVIVTTYNRNIPFNHQIHEINHAEPVKNICKVFVFNGLLSIQDAYNYCMLNQTPVVLEIPTNIYQMKCNDYIANIIQTQKLNLEHNINNAFDNISLAIGYGIDNDKEHSFCKSTLTENDILEQCVELITAKVLNIPIHVSVVNSTKHTDLYTKMFQSFHKFKNVTDSLCSSLDTKMNCFNICEDFETLLLNNNINVAYVNDSKKINTSRNKIQLIECFSNISLFFSSYGYNVVSFKDSILSCIILTEDTHSIPLSGLAEAYQDNVPLIVIVLTDKQNYPLNLETMVKKKFHINDLSYAKQYAIQFKCPVLIHYHVTEPIILGNYLDISLDIIPNPTLPILDDDVCNAILNDIHNSNVPLLYLGNVNVDPSKLILFANKLDAFVCTTYSAKGIFPETNARWLWCGLSSGCPLELNDIMNEIDLIIMLGGKISEVVTAHYRHHHIDNIKSYHININEEDVYYSSTPIICDANQFIDAMLKCMQLQKKKLPYDKLTESKHKIDKWFRFKANESKVAPYEILNKIPNDVITVCDSGNSMLHCVEQLRLTKPFHFFGPFDYSCMGFSIPVACGIAEYNPSKAIICVVGDGAFRMNYSEIQTIVKYKRSVKIIIFNDGELSMMSNIQKLNCYDKFDTTLAYLDIETLCSILNIQYYKYNSNLCMEDYQAPCIIDCPIDYQKVPLFLEGVLRNKMVLKENNYDMYSLIKKVKHSEKISIIDESFQVTLSYKNLYEHVCKLCMYYKNLNIKEQTVIALLNNNTYHNIPIHFCVAGLNCVLLNLNTRLTRHELNFICKDSNALYLISSNEFKYKIDYPFENVLWIEDDYEYIIQNTKMYETNRTTCMSDMNYQLYYTSGTTGKPKGVLLSHKNVYLHMKATIEEFHFTDTDIWGHISPMYHLVDAFSIYAITYVLGTHMFLKKNDISKTVNLLQKITVTNIATSLCQILIQHIETSNKNITFPLRLLSCGGSPLSEKYICKIIEIFQCKFFVSYGMTECCGKIAITLGNHLDQKNNIEILKTSGRKFSAIELKVINADNVEIKNDNKEIGEVCIRGGTVFKGYLNVSNQDVFTADGWFKTGDLAIMNSENYITIVDRKTNMILCGSENVYTVEVENVIKEIQNIKDCFVFGIENETFGNNIHVAVELFNTNIEIDKQKFIQFCQSKLANYKIPQHIHSVARLPYSETGKIQKHKLITDLYEIQWNEVTNIHYKHTIFDYYFVDIKCGYFEDKENTFFIKQDDNTDKYLDICEKLQDLFKKYNSREVHIKFIIDASYYFSISALLRVLMNEHKGFHYTMWCFDDFENNSFISKYYSSHLLQHNEVFIRNHNSKTIIQHPVLKKQTFINTNKYNFCDKNYIIIGGNGGIGRSITDWLLKTKCVNQVIILSRSKVTFENNGIIHLQVDITKKNDVLYLKKYLIEHNINVHGVFQLAGVLHDTLFENTSMDSFKEILDPKINGTNHILDLFTNAEFVLLFSSIYSIFGYPKLSHYSLANGYLNDIAIRYPNAKSIQWATWDTAGMAAKMGEKFEVFWKSQGMHFITHEKGIDILENIINNNSKIVGAYYIDWELFNINKIIKSFSLIESFVTDNKNHEAEIDNTKEHTQTIYCVNNGLMNDIQKILSEILCIPENSDIFNNKDAALIDLGIDSLHTANLHTKVNNIFKTDIPLIDFFGKINTINDLCNYIENSHKSECSKTSDLFVQDEIVERNVHDMKECMFVKKNEQLQQNVMIESNVTLGTNVIFGKNVIIKSGTIIGNNCFISNVHIGNNNSISDNCYINGDKYNTHKNIPIQIGDNNEFDIGIIITDGVYIDSNNYFSHYSIIGGKPNDTTTNYNWKDMGCITIGKNNIFKDRITIHNATCKNNATIIKDGSYFHSNVHIGHDSIIENNVELCVNVVLAGFSTIMKNSVMGINSFTMPAAVIGSYSMVGASTRVKKNIAPFTVYSYMSDYEKKQSYINAIGLTKHNISNKDISDIQKYIFEDGKHLDDDKWYKHEYRRFLKYVDIQKKKLAMSV